MIPRAGGSHENPQGWLVAVIWYPSRCLQCYKTLLSSIPLQQTERSGAAALVRRGVYERILKFGFSIGD